MKLVFYQSDQMLQKTNKKTSCINSNNSLIFFPPPLHGIKVKLLEVHCVEGKTSNLTMNVTANSKHKSKTLWYKIFY